MKISTYGLPTVLGALVALSACSDGQAPTAGIEDEPRNVEALLMSLGEPSEGDIVDEYIVLFDEDLIGDPREEAEDIVAETSGTLLFVYSAALKGFAAEIPASELNILAAHAEVSKVERNQVAGLSGSQGGATWALDRIDQRGLPLNQTYTWAPDGSGTHIYVIDTGIRTTHIEFGGRAQGVFDAFNDGNGTADCHGHGTHVAGIAAGSTYGVAKNARVYGVRVMNCQGTGSIAGVIAGLDWVTANGQRPAVANMSIGGGPSDAMDQAIANSSATGITYVVAAGNANRDACGDSPARAPDAITAASSTIDDQRSNFSNWGPCVDMFAPGSNVTSAYHTGDNVTADFSGTSMSTPHIAGAAALYLSLNPSATVAQVTNALKSNATNGVVQNPGSNTPNLMLYTGFLGGGGESSPPPPTGGGDDAPVPVLQYSCNGLNCTFDARNSSDDVAISHVYFQMGDGAQFRWNHAEVLTYSYGSPGTYTVWMSIYDFDGNEDHVRYDLNVTANGSEEGGKGGDGSGVPIPRLQTNCSGLTCTFDARASSDDKGISHVYFQMGDGAAFRWDPTRVLSHSYSSPGTYTVYMNIYDFDGNEDFVRTEVTANAGSPPGGGEGPDPKLTFSCNGLSCTFDPTGTTAVSGLSHAYFQLGDGTAFRWDPSRVMTHTYSSPGTYAVYMNVWDVHGNQSLIRVTPTVQSGGSTPPTPPPSGSSPTPRLQVTCSSYTCTFDARGSSDDKGISHAYFQMGDGSAFRWDPRQLLTHTYPSTPGIYTAYMTVYDFDGNQSTFRADIKLPD